MRTVMARIPIGRTVVTQEVDLFTIEEAKTELSKNDWEIGVDIYSAEQPGKRIGWLAEYSNGDGIYIEAR